MAAIIIWGSSADVRISLPKPASSTYTASVVSRGLGPSFGRSFGRFCDWVDS